MNRSEIENMPGWEDLFNVFELIKKERFKQNEKWGIQDHDNFSWLAILTEEVGEVAQAALHDVFGGKAKGTLDIELVHVVAVGVQWMECLLRNQRKSPPDAFTRKETK